MASIPTLRFADMRRTTTFRLAAMFGAVFSVAVCLLAVLIYLLTAQQLMARSDRVLNREIARLANLDRAHLLDGIRQALASNTSALNYYAVAGPDGRPLIGNLTLPPGSPVGRPFELSPSRSVPVPLRVLAVHVDAIGTVIVARDISQIGAVRNQMLVIVSFGAIATILSLLAAGIALSIGPMQRTRALEQIAQRIAAGEIHLRMPISPRLDELDTFAATVNRMVDEIERLMAEVKGTTDAIAHDLRSPLSRLRNRLGAMRGASTDGDPAGADSTDVLVDAVEELDALLGRFNALMRISEVHVAGRRAGFRVFDPFPMAGAVCELFEPLAEENGVRVKLVGSFGLLIEGDEKLLFEALSNLVENAIKFIQPGGTISVSVEAIADTVCLEVRDNGPGIPADERLAVQRRFHRGATALHVPGSGLGLDLVSAIARLHGSKLDLLDADPGLAACIQFKSQRATISTD